MGELHTREEQHQSILQIVLKTPKKFLLKSVHPKKILEASIVSVFCFVFFPFFKRGRKEIFKMTKKLYNSAYIYAQGFGRCYFRYIN